VDVAYIDVGNGRELGAVALVSRSNPFTGIKKVSEGGYNPHKQGLPFHIYHSYLMANVRLVLEVDVQSGDRNHSDHSMPGLIQLLRCLPPDCQPAFIRGDCDWGNNAVMSELETLEHHYLFILKQFKRVKQLMPQVSGHSLTETGNSNKVSFSFNFKVGINLGE